jgi:hypothetical protein
VRRPDQTIDDHTWLTERSSIKPPASSRSYRCLVNAWFCRQDERPK